MKQHCLDAQFGAGERLRRILGSAADLDDEESRLKARMRACLVDPWCRSQVRWRARRTIRHLRLPPDWQGDIEHQTLVIIADKLLRRRLRLPASVESGEHVLAWLCVVIQRACVQAARGMSRMKRFEVPLSWIEPVRCESAILDLRFDVAMAIDRLGEPSRSIVLLSEQGHSLVDAAGLLQLTYKQTCGAFADGLTRLRRALADHYLQGPK